VKEMIGGTEKVKQCNRRDKQRKDVKTLVEVAKTFRLTRKLVKLFPQLNFSTVKILRLKAILQPKDCLKCMLLSTMRMIMINFLFLLLFMAVGEEGGKDDAWKFIFASVCNEGNTLFLFVTFQSSLFSRGRKFIWQVKRD
jgi:uncharacterized membrane protein YbhN (UPF0104 family)